MKTEIENKIKEVLKNLGIEESVSLERPAEMANGDYSTNVALSCAKKIGMNPKELAEKIVNELNLHMSDLCEKIETAGPGFINFYLSPEYYKNEISNILKSEKDYGKNILLKGKKVMVEYTQPNPFKPFHIGHLMSNAIGESLSRIVEFSGAETIRANYQGDIGLHVAKAMYGILKSGGAYPEGSVGSIAEFIGKCYSDASTLYEDNEEIKNEIDILNKRLYAHDSELWPLYEEGRKITLEAFEELYKILGTKFDVYYFESEMAQEGTKLVQEFLQKGIFENSDGAIVFHAEKYNPKLHTRVFLTKANLPTYEAKEIGLTVKKFRDYNPDISIIDTATEQKDYMAVVTESIRQMFPKDKYADRMMHVTHGMMRFASGKMSSRKGNVITGESLVRDTVEIIKEKMAEREWNDADKREVAEIVGVSAIKYSILRSKIGSDIVYDVDKSISTEGDSGPYLQYSLTRANSVLKKVAPQNLVVGVPSEIGNLEKMLVRFPETVVRAWTELEPHHIVTYLTELAAAFNSFYAKEKISDPSDPNSPYRVALTQAFSIVMQNGLYLIGIKIPNKM